MLAACIPANGRALALSASYVRHCNLATCVYPVASCCLSHCCLQCQEPGSDPTAMAASRAAATGQGGGWMDTILNLIPGRKQKITDEPNEDAIKRTHDYLRSVILSCSPPT